MLETEFFIKNSERIYLRRRKYEKVKKTILGKCNKRR